MHLPGNLELTGKSRGIFPALWNLSILIEYRNISCYQFLF